MLRPPTFGHPGCAWRGHPTDGLSASLGAATAPLGRDYRRREPEASVLHAVVCELWPVSSRPQAPFSGRVTGGNRLISHMCIPQI